METKNYCYIVKFWESDAEGNQTSNGHYIDGVYATLEKAQKYLEFVRWAFADAPAEDKREDAQIIGDTEIKGIHFRVPFLVITHKDGSKTYYYIDRRELK